MTRLLYGAIGETGGILRQGFYQQVISRGMGILKIRQRIYPLRIRCFPGERR